MLKDSSNLKSLQVLRALAATCVVYYHIGVVPHFGSFGVDIFFVLSGFVMALVINKGETPCNFLINRFSRIVPMYWILTAILFCLAIVVPELLNSTTPNILNFIKSILFIPYYKENGSLNPMLPVGWTLNYEVYFYILLWLAIIAYRDKFIVVTTIFILIVYFWLGHDVDNRLFNDYFGNEVIFEFVFGFFVFFIYKKFDSANIRPVNSMILIGICVVLMVCLEISEFNKPRIIVFGIPSSILLFLALALEPSLIPRDNIVIRTFVDMGNASYATYLSHFYVIEGVRKIVSSKYKIFSIYSPEGTIISLVLSLIVGKLLYCFIDKPLYTKLRGKLVALCNL